MIAETLISDCIVPLRTSDTGEEALQVFNDFFIRHLPVVEDKKLIGLISEEDLLDYDIEATISSYNLPPPATFITTTDHIYEVLRRMAEYQLSVIPVLDDKNNYVGLISQEDLLRQFASMGSFSEPGSIIVLETIKSDYSLAEFARIVESENAAVLCSFITSTMESHKIEVSLKVNLQNLQPLLATFERFGYQIKASFSEDEYINSLKERYDSLMLYLNV